MRVPGDGGACGSARGRYCGEADMPELAMAANDVKSEGAVAIGWIDFRQEPGDASTGNK
jgi:hypothetical protein